MSKIKKVLAMILSMAMILGMSLTTFAATATSGNITVTGLVKENTKVEVYQVLKADANVNDWIVNEWAKDYVEEENSETGKSEYEFDWDGLYANLPEQEEVTISTDYWTQDTNTGTVVFKELPLGAYLVKATSLVDGSVTVYNVMGTNNTTYDDMTHLMKGADVTVYAKASTIPVDKRAEEGDNFIAKGEEVTFTITTTFPSFTEEELSYKPAPSYVVKDVSDDLQITGVESVVIGDTTLDQGAYKADYSETETNTYVIDLSSQIGTENANSGKTVVITYKATVLTDDGYSNTANVVKNGTTIGTDEEQGYTATIEITKFGDEQEKLAGAKFNVYDGKDKTGTKLWFTGSDGVYSLAKQGDQGATDVVETAGTDGKFTIKGLDEGDYFFDEIEAPEGYSINTNGISVNVSDKENNEEGELVPVEHNVTVEDSMTDTKLSSLPSTGGIGTTIFTIGGCAIMIAAAGMFFVSRRKENK